MKCTPCPLLTTHFCPGDSTKTCCFSHPRSWLHSKVQTFSSRKLPHPQRSPPCGPALRSIGVEPCTRQTGMPAPLVLSPPLSHSFSELSPRWSQWFQTRRDTLCSKSWKRLTVAQEITGEISVSHTHSHLKRAW